MGRGRSFLWAAHYCAALATYPEVVTHRASTSPPFLRSTSSQPPLWVPRSSHHLARAGGDLTGDPRSHGAKERRNPPLFGLAPCGVCPATVIAGGAVRSYRTFSPLPRLTEIRRGGMFSVALSVNGPLRATARTLSGTPLCGVRTFLCEPASSQPKSEPRAPAATVRPSS